MSDQISYENPINAFTMKIVSTQIISYFIVFFQIIIYFACIYPNFSENNKLFQIIITVLYSIITLALCITALIASCIDPSDDVVRQYKRSIVQKRQFVDNNYFYCNYCQSYCLQTSRHCRTCNRCVDGFDHHCIWINNCIGKKNYNTFFVMTILSDLNMGIFILSAIILTLELKFSKYLIQIIIVWIYMFLAAGLLLVLLYLTSLHFYLIIQGITTFQYIKRQRNQPKDNKVGVTIQQIQRGSQQNQVADNQIKNDNIFHISADNQINKIKHQTNQALNGTSDHLSEKRDQGFMRQQIIVVQEQIKNRSQRLYDQSRKNISKRDKKSKIINEGIELPPLKPKKLPTLSNSYDQNTYETNINIEKTEENQKENEQQIAVLRTNLQIISTK